VIAPLRERLSAGPVRGKSRRRRRGADHERRERRPVPAIPDIESRDEASSSTRTSFLTAPVTSAADSVPVDSYLRSSAFHAEPRRAGDHAADKTADPQLPEQPDGVVMSEAE